MNKAYFLFIALLFSLLVTSCESLNAQEKGTPQAAKDTFKKMYPKENDPDWEKDRNGNFEAHFKKDGTHYRADYSPEGKWIETENSVSEKDLPKAIEKLLENEYEEFKIVELEFVTHHVKGEFYDLELKTKGDEKFDLMVRSDGEIIGRD